MTSLDAYKMQRLKTTIFSLLSQSLLTKKEGCWNFRIFVHTIFY